MGRGTWGEGLVPAVEFRLESGEDGTGRLCSPFIFPVRDSHTQTEQATSGTLVYLSTLFSQAPRSYKSPCLCKPCIPPPPSSISFYSQRSAQHTVLLGVHLSPARYKILNRADKEHMLAPFIWSEFVLKEQVPLQEKKGKWFKEGRTGQA